jgi:hypothetical protein
MGGSAELSLVGPGRVELPTSRLSGARSNHLSYGPAEHIKLSGLTLSCHPAKCPAGPHVPVKRASSFSKSTYV